ncbi:TPA: hypothetical protein JFP82_002143 [Vibrio cholerae O1]|nr:hypothetical protein [Vibrio cholerae O1]
MGNTSRTIHLASKTVALFRVMSMSQENNPFKGINWSYSTNAMAQEYQLIMEENKPSLADNQWQAFHWLYDCYKPTTDAAKEADSLPERLLQAYHNDFHVSAALGSEEQALSFISEIRQWSRTKRLAAIYQAKANWASAPPVRKLGSSPFNKAD